MKREDLAKVRQIFYSALELSPAERKDYVKNSSADDSEVRREVEKILCSYESDTFDESYFAGLESEKNLTFSEGENFGHFEIIKKIGAGGMGEVWLARDTNLGRNTAIKILHSEFTENAERMRRFVQEARAVSALNHPNILTIYEIGKAGEINYIAAEFIKGKTLGEKLKKQSFSTEETLEIAVQIVSALCAAHESDIVHRDIKPENIMIRNDGLVKVLDFGLVKLTEDDGDKSRDETILNTAPGMILGTVSYMSPEQIRGDSADARSDIWSFGVVFYEMLTGKKPFPGETAGDIIADTLKSEVSFPPETARRNLLEAENIISRTLAKNRNQRYQTSKELLGDLKALKKNFEIQTELAKSGRHLFAPVPEKRSANYAKYLILACLPFLIIALYLFKDKIFPARAVPGSAEVKALTTSGNIVDVAISRDGNLLAFVKREKLGQSLWIRQKNIGTSEIKLTEPNPDTVMSGIAFHPNGGQIYFLQRLRNSSINTLYSVPILGGQPPKAILEDIDSAPHFSPDGKKFAFMRRNIQLGITSLIIAEENGSNPKTLIESKSPDNLMLRPLSWSADGKRIFCVADGLTGTSNTALRNISQINIETGERKIISDRNWREFDSITQSKNFDGIIFAATDIQTPLQYQIWFMQSNGSRIIRLTNDAELYGNVSASADTGEIIARQTRLEMHVWTVNAAKPDAPARRISPNNSDGGSGITWSANGDLVYTSSLNGVNSLQKIPAGGGNPVTLTTGDYALSQPCGTADGRYFIYNSTLENSMNIWRIDADGGNLKKLTAEQGEYTNCAPDGKTVYFNAVREGGKSSIWKVSIDGGTPERVTRHISLRPQAAPDGKTLACYYRAEAKAPWQIGILSLADGEVLKTIDLPKSVGLNTAYKWSADGKSLVFTETRDGIANLWQYSLNGGQPVKLTNFNDESLPLIADFDISPKNGELAVVRARRTGDIVQIVPVR